MPKDMKIKTTHHVDAGEPDAEGACDYRYEYDLYFFSEDEVAVVARSYIDDPEEAHFLRMEIDGKPQLMKRADLRRPLLVSAARHLRAAGKKRLNWLSGRGDGYESVVFRNKQAGSRQGRDRVSATNRTSRCA